MFLAHPAHMIPLLLYQELIDPNNLRSLPPCSIVPCCGQSPTLVWLTQIWLAKGWPGLINIVKAHLNVILAIRLYENVVVPDAGSLVLTISGLALRTLAQLLTYRVALVAIINDKLPQDLL